MNRLSPRLPALDALFAFALALCLMIVLSPALYRALGLGAMLIIQLGLIAGPAILFALLRGGASPIALRILGIRVPRRRALLGSALIGCSFWYLNMRLVAPIGHRYLGGREFVEKLENTILGGDVSLWIIVLMIALLPALCEEVLMRGSLARALVPRLGRAAAIVVSAALFGAMHLHPAHMLTTFAFGLVLGFAVVMTDSVWPAVLMHLLNNALVLLVGAKVIPAITDSLRSSPELWLPIAAFLSVCGCLLIRTSKNPGLVRNPDVPS